MKLPTLSRLPAAFLALCLLGLGAAHALEVPTREALVNDRAGVLSANIRGKLNDHLLNAQQKYGVQIAALIVPSLEGESVEGFAAKTAAAWGLGKQGEDKSVLLLVALKEEQIRIETGRGVEGKLTEALGARIINEEMLPFFREGAAAPGVSYGLLALVPAAVVGKYTPSEKALQSAARVRAAAASAGQGAAPSASAAKPAEAAPAAADAEGGAEAGAPSRMSGGKFLLTILLVILGIVLGALTRRHNWRRVCLAVLVLGAVWGVSMGFAPTVLMSGMAGMTATAMFWGFFALFFLGIRTIWGAIRGKAAPAPSEAGQEAAAPAVERADASAPGGGKQSTWRETPQEARARREAIASASRARRQAMSSQQEQKSMFKEVLEALFGADEKASQEPRWGTIAATICVLVMAPLFVYFALGDEMEFRRSTEREEVTAHLVDVSVSCTGSGSKEECTHTPFYSYRFHGEDYTYGGAQKDTNSAYAKPYFPKEIQLTYYKNDAGKWVRAKTSGPLGYLKFYGGALFMFVMALGVLVVELKKLGGKREKAPGEV